MKKLTKIIMLVLLVIAAMTSCQEETVQPSQEYQKIESIWKEGNITGVDDWQNQV